MCAPTGTDRLLREAVARAQISTVLQCGAGCATVRAIAMPELGHLAGLKHVLDADELMYGENTPQTAFGRGAREGLRQLGLGPCFSD